MSDWGLEKFPCDEVSFEAPGGPFATAEPIECTLNLWLCVNGGDRTFSFWGFSSVF